MEGLWCLLAVRLPSLDELAELVQEHGVTSLWLTAGLFHLAVEERMTGFSGLRQLLAGGDTLSPEHLKMAAELWPETQLINGYGPTEGTTFSCCHHFSKRELFDLKKTPIGRPIHETQVYILDADLQLVLKERKGSFIWEGKGSRAAMRIKRVSLQRSSSQILFSILGLMNYVTQT